MDERPQFDAKYQVGVEQIDREHRQLFEIVARVYDSLEARDDKAQSLIRAAAAELLDYTATHFTSEEGLMEQAGYPDLEAHRQQHEHLLSRARDMEMRIEIEDKYVAVELSQFLYRWLIEHIEASDRKFGEYLIAQGKT
jgi:hemerythrin